MTDIRGSNVVITGASHGVGPYIARAFAQKGANIVLAARTASQLDAVASALSSSNVKVLPVSVDLRSATDCQTLIARTEAELGAVDILVNNASVHYTGALDTLSAEEINEIVQTNLLAAITLTSLVLPGMLERKRGHLVHNASLAGKVGMPYLAAYSATKYGLVGFNNALQAELRGTGVHSTAMCFGFISKAGMWARFGRPVHPAFGESSPERVAQMSVRAVEQNWVEKIVNPLPVMPVVGTWAIAPGLASWLFKTLQIEKFMEGNAEAVQSDRSILNVSASVD